MFCVQEGNLFPHRLTHIPERSLYASTFDSVFDCVGIIFSLMTHMPSTLMVLKGVDLCLHSFSSLLPGVSLAGVLKGVSVHVHIAMVLKELDGWSWKDLDATLVSVVTFCDLFPSNGLERNLWSWCLFVLFSTIDLETLLHNTWMRPNRVLASCLTMISLHVLVSTL